MAKVLTHMCMSLDGFVAQPDENPAELFDWYWSGDVVVPSAQEIMSFSVDAASAPMLQELTSDCGALIAGPLSRQDPIGRAGHPDGHVIQQLVRIDSAVPVGDLTQPFRHLAPQRGGCAVGEVLALGALQAPHRVALRGELEHAVGVGGERDRGRGHPAEL